MMEIVVNCAGCGTQFRVASALAGKKSRCNHCGHVFKIPLPSAVAQPSPIRKPPPLGTETARGEEQWLLSLDDEPLAPKASAKPVPPPMDDVPLAPPPRSPFPEPLLAAKSVIERDPADFAVKIAGWYFLVGVFAAAVMLIYAQIAGPTIAQFRFLCAIVFCLLILSGLALLVWGNIWLVVIAFRESVSQGWLCLLVPFYVLGFIFRRFEQTRGAAALLLCSSVIILLALAVPLIDATVRDPASNTTAVAASDTSGLPGGGNLGGPLSAATEKPTVDRAAVDAVAPKLVEAPPSPPGDAPSPPLGGARRKRAGRNRPLADQSPNLSPAAREREQSGSDDVAEVSPVPASPPRTANRPGPPRPRSEPEFPADADEVDKALIELKSHELNKLRSGVRRLLHWLPDERLPQVVAALVPLLEMDDNFFVSDVEKALAIWKSPDAVPALIARTSDHRGFVRHEAIKALARIKDERGVEPIAARIKEDGHEVEEAFKEMGSIAEPAVIARLTSPDRDVRRRACEILKSIGGHATLRAMLRLPEDPDHGAQAAAEEAVKAIVAREGPLPGARSRRGR
jgi:predicted Zn finger-like uncharacterized protein